MIRGNMTKEEFEIRYIEQSGINKDFYHKNFVTLRCECDYENCKGWACVANFEKTIRIHNELYAPKNNRR